MSIPHFKIGNSIFRTSRAVTLYAHSALQYEVNGDIIQVVVLLI